MDYMLLISTCLFLFAVGIYLSKKIRLSKLPKIIFSFLVFISILFYGFYGIANYFTGEGITQAAIYHVNYGLSGAGFLEYKGLILASFFYILLGACFSLWLISKKFHKKNNKKIYSYIIFLLIISSLFFNPVIISFKETRYTKFEKLKFNENSEFYNYYKSPEITEINKSKNLVFIYGEGLERTYFNKTIFPGLIENLKKIESKSISFTNINQDKYSHHTVGGIVASQCGFPLVSPSHANSMSGMDTYLESAICLGDLLHKEEYYLSYYGGADLNFAGKGKFFSTHKFDEIKGKNQLLLKLTDKSYKTGWGLYDDSLFDLAYERFTELAENKNKFAMFLLTLDTHHPNGDPSKSCNNIIYKDGKNPILNSVKCSDYLISEFVEKIRQSEYSKDTIIVIVSDHLALRNTAVDLLNKADRKNLFLINQHDSNESIKINKLGSTLDTGSTILPFIGYKGDIGLARDIINRKESDSEIKDIQNNLKKLEPYLVQFWNFPKIEKSLKIDIKNKKAYIDNREFKIPILIELNNNLQTTTKFQFDIGENIGLSSHLSNMEKNKSFLLIESCNRIENIINKTINYSGFCLLAGKKDEYEYIKLESNTKFSKNEIKEIVGISKLETNQLPSSFFKKLWYILIKSKN